MNFDLQAGHDEGREYSIVVLGISEGLPSIRVHSIWATRQAPGSAVSP
jgi:hypothetical protein